MVLIYISQENTTTNSLVIGFHCIVSAQEMKVADSTCGASIPFFLSFLYYI